MAFQFIINMIIAFIWMFLHNEWTFSFFIVGFLVGAGFVFVFRRFFGGRYYMYRVWKCVKLMLLFLRELVLSSIVVIRHIIQPELKIRPGIFAYETKLSSNWELTVLACLLTLTPGTLILEVSKERQTLYLHAMNMADEEKYVSQIRDIFEKAILEVTR
ncbi:Na+/H+ antiporter subunit E [Paenibacillus daejeonensis]|uniref:Na+/H+ antiporter subunit E n=1 Tax=Paenibacillus daejeonensis TaxID=135193 RepID=UPI00036402A0|nr:Na+/H+ antiporter subunit E [Paenibacillus daejeonensis]